MFSTRSPPTAQLPSLPFPSPPLPVRSSFHHLTPTSSSSFIFFLSVITTPLSPFSPTPPPLPPASRALYINHTLVSTHLTLSSLPPPLLSPLASLLFTVAQIKPTTLLNPQKKRLRGWTARKEKSHWTLASSLIWETERGRKNEGRWREGNFLIWGGVISLKRRMPSSSLPSGGTDTLHTIVTWFYTFMWILRRKVKIDKSTF